MGQEYPSEPGVEATVTDAKGTRRLTMMALKEGTFSVQMRKVETSIPAGLRVLAWEGEVEGNRFDIAVAPNWLLLQYKGNSFAIRALDLVPAMLGMADRMEAE